MLYQNYHLTKKKQNKTKQKTKTKKNRKKNRKNPETPEIVVICGISPGHGNVLFIKKMQA